MPALSERRPTSRRRTPAMAVRAVSSAKRKLSFGRSLGGLLFGGLLQAGIGAGGKLGLEFLDPSSGIDILQAAGIERMARAANIDTQLRTRAARREFVTAGAMDRSFHILRMNAFFHGRIP